MQVSFPHYRLLLTKYLKPQKGRVIGLASALLSGIFLQIINPQILGYFIDTAVGGGSQQNLLIAALLFTAIALLTQVFSVITTYLGETVAWTATNALRIDLVAHCLQLDLSFHKAHTPGELLERVDGDVNLLSRFFSQLVIHVLGNAILLLGILGVLWFENPLAGCTLTIFALVALLLLLSLRFMAIAPWAKYRQISADFYGMLSEHLTGREDLRANGAVSYVMYHFYALLQRWLPAYQTARLTSTVLWFSSVGLFTIGNAIALALSAYLWNKNTITIGTAYLIFHYTNLLAQPIDRIREELEQMQQVEASIHRIFDLLHVPVRVQSTGRLKLGSDALSVSFKDVYFWYKETEQKELEKYDRKHYLEKYHLSKEQSSNTSSNPQLEDLSFNLPAGQILGLLGRTGSGKSTIARLLLRLYEAQAGEICLGDRSLSSFPLSELRQHIGFVTQDVQLFKASVRENLTFFNPHISTDALMVALEDLGLETWVQSLPKGLDTDLGSDGVGLSAGQAQLLALARVFIKNPGLVLLDEASSRLDPLTEALIERAIAKLLANRTGIIIAHRLQTLQRADQILILERGRILEYGHFQTLANQPDSHFARLLRNNLSL